MGELEPCAGEGISELLGVFQEAARDFLVGWIEAQREVGGEHRGQVALGGISGVGDDGLGAFGDPLVRACWAFGEFPIVFEEVLEIVIAPLGRSLGPSHLESARDGVAAFAGFVGVLPTEALLLDRGRFGLGADIFRITGAVAFAESVTTGNERDGFLVVHGHAGEGLANVARRRHGVGVSIRTLGIHINEAHLHGGERVFEFTITGVAFVLEPFALGAPVDVFLGLPDVSAAAGETESFETHRLERDIAGEDHEIGPGKFAAVFLFDRPEEAAGLVEVAVVGPAVEGCEALAAIASAAASVTRAVSAGAVPGHANEERAVVAEIGRPPILRIGHERGEVLLHGGEVERLELLRVVEILTHRIRLRGVLVQDAKVELVRPPVAVGGAGACELTVVEGALGFGGHGFLKGWSFSIRMPRHKGRELF